MDAVMRQDLRDELDQLPAADSAEDIEDCASAFVASRSMVPAAQTRKGPL